MDHSEKEWSIDRIANDIETLVGGYMQLPEALTDMKSWYHIVNRDKPDTIWNRRFPIITLVGSTKFPELFQEAQKELARLGWIVFSVTEYGHKEGLDMKGDIKHILDASYLQKIKMSNAILVLNKDQYIGLGAWDEICYALAQRKGVYFLEESFTACKEEFVQLLMLEGIYFNENNGQFKYGEPVV